MDTNNASAETSCVPSWCTLIIRTPQEDNKIVDFSDGTYLIGRADSCRIQIRDPEVSRQHCIIQKQNQRIFVTDCGSSNGTYVNGIRIEGVVELTGSAKINIGTSVLFLRFV